MTDRSLAKKWNIEVWWIGPPADGISGSLFANTFKRWGQVDEPPAIRLGLAQCLRTVVMLSSVCELLFPSFHCLSGNKVGY